MKEIVLGAIVDLQLFQMNSTIINVYISVLRIYKNYI
jgi:hypothetical protein